MRKSNLSRIINKDQEISNSLQNHWESCILFTIFCFVSIPSAIGEPGWLSVLVALLSTLILLNTITGIIDLRKLRIKLQLNPEGSLNMVVRQPILYWAIFWYLPR